MQSERHVGFAALWVLSLLLQGASTAHFVDEAPRSLPSLITSSTTVHIVYSNHLVRVAYKLLAFPKSLK